MSVQLRRSGARGFVRGRVRVDLEREAATRATWHEARRRLLRAADKGKRVARAKAPVRTGALRRSIRVWYTAGQRKIRLLAAVPYALYNERHNRRRRGFMRKGLEAARRDLAKAR